MADVPSYMALATSVISARVGRGFFGHRFEHLGGGNHLFACHVAALDKPFWMPGMVSIGTSTPMSPRAYHYSVGLVQYLVAVFDARRIFDFCDYPYMVQPSFSSSWRIWRISSADCVNDAATKSKSFFTPNSRSARSRSLINGMESCVPGTFTPLRSDMGPPFITVQTMSVPRMVSIPSSISPSSISMVPPGPQRRGKARDMLPTRR